jgi:cytoskeletal protein CcmA (bactofilin family)
LALRFSRRNEGLTAMFGRKKDDASSNQKADAGMPRKPESMPPTRAPTAPSLNLRRPLPARPATPGTNRMSDIPGILPPRSEGRSYGVEGKTLVVGREIALAGQIAACDKLVVEGQVEADLDHCRQLDISQTGFFKGSAIIEEAEICGRFDGSLTVRKRLRVRSSARITADVTYGQIEVEAGAEITGDIKVFHPEAAPPKIAAPKAVAPAPSPVRDSAHPVEPGE